MRWSPAKVFWKSDYPHVEVGGTLRVPVSLGVLSAQGYGYPQDAFMGFRIVEFRVLGFEYMWMAPGVKAFDDAVLVLEAVV